MIHPTPNTWACIRLYEHGPWAVSWHRTSEEAYDAARAQMLAGNVLYAYCAQASFRFSNLEAIARKGAPDLEPK